MSSPAAFTASIRHALRRFRRNRRGSSAVEFALVAPVFFALLFAIIETVIVFFAGQVLETGVQDAGRQLHQRDQLSLYPSGRLCDGKDRHELERFFLYAPSPIELRHV
jgi:Flp pilus assembly pilin Flp